MTLDLYRAAQMKGKSIQSYHCVACAPNCQKYRVESHHVVPGQRGATKHYPESPTIPLCIAHHKMAHAGLLHPVPTGDTWAIVMLTEPMKLHELAYAIGWEPDDG